MCQHAFLSSVCVPHSLSDAFDKLNALTKEGKDVLNYAGNGYGGEIKEMKEEWNDVMK